VTHATRHLFAQEHGTLVARIERQHAIDHGIRLIAPAGHARRVRLRQQPGHRDFALAEERGAYFRVVRRLLRRLFEQTERALLIAADQRLFAFFESLVGGAAGKAECKDQDEGCTHAARQECSHLALPMVKVCRCLRGSKMKVTALADTDSTRY
jgi:hypothetical protein